MTETLYLAGYTVLILASAIIAWAGFEIVYAVRGLSTQIATADERMKLQHRHQMERSLTAIKLLKAISQQVEVQTRTMTSAESQLKDEMKAGFYAPTDDMAGGRRLERIEHSRLNLNPDDDVSDEYMGDVISELEALKSAR